MNPSENQRANRGWLSEFGSVCCGRILEFDSSGFPLVNFPGNVNGAVKARFLQNLQLNPKNSGPDIEVLMVFEHGDPTRPIIVGIVETTFQRCGAEPRKREALVDGRRVRLKGDEEVSLVCGRSSITLTKDGRIRLNGVDILSRASGANKIRGASVNIN